MANGFCSLCFKTVSQTEKTEIEIKGTKQVVHKNCLTNALEGAYDNLLILVKKSSVQAQINPFSTLEEAKNTIQEIADKLAASDSKKDFNLLDELANLSIEYLFWRPNIPKEALKAKKGKVILKTNILSFNTKVIPIYKKITRMPAVEAFKNEEFIRENKFANTEKFLPHLKNDILAIVNKPFRLHVDYENETAATDCIADIYFNPYPFEIDEINAGFGIGYHESGHIVYSPYGIDILTQAENDGGLALQKITNILLDRKDDIKLTQKARGFAGTLQKRMSYLFPKEVYSSNEQIHTLHQEKYSFTKWKMKSQKRRNISFYRRPKNAYIDFLFACKKHKKPRFAVTRKIMRLIRRKKLATLACDQILELAKKIHELLKASIEDNNWLQPETQFLLSWENAHKKEVGPKLSQKQIAKINNIISSIVSSERENMLKKIDNSLEKAKTSVSRNVYLGQSGSYGKRNDLKIIHCLPDAAKYQKIKNQIQGQINKIANILKKIETFSEYHLRRQEEGELDMSAVMQIAVGFTDFKVQTFLEHNIDAEIHLLLDQSPSMETFIGKAKKIAVLFNEAILAMGSAVTGHIWGFNDKLYSYGPCKPNSGIANAEIDDCTLMSRALPMVVSQLQRSQRNKKILISICDDGPDDQEMITSMVNYWLNQGIICIHILVNAYFSPNIFPFQLMFPNFDELSKDFGNIITRIINKL